MTVKELRAMDRLVYQNDTCRIFHCNIEELRRDVLDVMEQQPQWSLVVDNRPDRNDYFLIYFLK